MSSVACIVLAAGDGTRMRSATPKLLHPLCGRPIVAYVVALANALRCRPVIAVVGTGAQVLTAQLPRSWQTVTQRERRGTGHAVGLALRRVPSSAGTVLVLYGDQPLVQPETVRRLLAQHRAQGASCTILTARVDDPREYGRVLGEDGRVSRIVEAADATAEQRAVRDINVGVAAFQRAALAGALGRVTPANAQGEYYLTDAVTWLAEHPTHGPVAAVRTEDPVEALGINSREELAAASRAQYQRIAARWMNRGVTIVDPATTYIDDEARIGQDTTIFPCTMIERDAVIGKRCAIGPFAHLRPGVRLADDVRVGNFAEVVRSSLGARVRMNHCSYLGDATVAADVNVGAGTITANFDGCVKHRTRIGARAFLGSGTVIVAPATVGPRAVTGAGCVVTRGTRVQPGSVVVGVPARPLKTSTSKER